jgi:hypothetical protein
MVRVAGLTQCSEAVSASPGPPSPIYSASIRVSSPSDRVDECLKILSTIDFYRSMEVVYLRMIL